MDQTNDSVNVEIWNMGSGFLLQITTVDEVMNVIATSSNEVAFYVALEADKLKGEKNGQDNSSTI